MPILYFKDGSVAGEFSEHALKCHNLKAGDEVKKEDVSKICDSHFQFDPESNEHYRKDQFQQYESRVKHYERYNRIIDHGIGSVKPLTDCRKAN